MSTTPSAKKVNYPTRDGRPVGETDVHRDNLATQVWTLQAYFAADPNVYVSGNLMMYYVEGDRRRHLSPDVFVVRGRPKGRRLYYLVWEEGKAPDCVIELTSRSTSREDLSQKFELYRDTLRVPEYFLCDPFEEYLKPSMQGYRLVDGQYEPIAARNGRLPSAILGLELVRQGSELRLFDPAAGRLLSTPDENAVALDQTAAALREREAEITALRREIERLKGGSAN